MNVCVTAAAVKQVFSFRIHDSCWLQFVQHQVPDEMPLSSNRVFVSILHSHDTISALCLKLNVNSDALFGSQTESNVVSKLPQYCSLFLLYVFIFVIMKLI